MLIDLFNNEERILLNSICTSERLSSLTKDVLLESLTFSRHITNDDDDGMSIDLLEGVIEKVANLSDDDFNTLKMSIPMATFTSEDK